MITQENIKHFIPLKTKLYRFNSKNNLITEIVTCVDSEKNNTRNFFVMEYNFYLEVKDKYTTNEFINASRLIPSVTDAYPNNTLHMTIDDAYNQHINSLLNAIIKTKEEYNKLKE